MKAKNYGDMESLLADVVKTDMEIGIAIELKIAQVNWPSIMGS